MMPPRIGCLIMGPQGPLAVGDRNRLEISGRRILAHWRVCNARARADHRALEMLASVASGSDREMAAPVCCTSPAATTLLITDWVLVFISYMKTRSSKVRACARIV